MNYNEPLWATIGLFTVSDAILTSRQGNLRAVTKHHTNLLKFRSRAPFYKQFSTFSLTSSKTSMAKFPATCRIGHCCVLRVFGWLLFASEISRDSPTYNKLTVNREWIKLAPVGGKPVLTSFVVFMVCCQATAAAKKIFTFSLKGQLVFLSR